MRLPKRSQSHEISELSVVQVIDGDERAVAEVVAALRKAGCVVDSAVELTAGKWEITARWPD